MVLNNCFSGLSAAMSDFLFLSFFAEIQISLLYEVFFSKFAQVGC